MRCVLLLLCLLIPTIAVADSDLDAYVRSARTMARRGDCTAVAAVSEQVRKQSPEFHASSFSRDPEIANCTRREREASVTVPATAVDRKSESTALALSIGVTLAGGVSIALASERRGDGMQSVLVLGGLGMLLVGPTAGHIYAGNTWNGGLQARVASAGVVVGAGALALLACPPFSSCGDDKALADSFAVVALVGVLAYGGAALYEIGSTGRSVRKSNLQLVPTGNGLAAVGRF